MDNQITDDSPINIPEDLNNTKQKDPRKVEAGKALARGNVARRKNKKKESPQLEMSTFYDGMQKAGVVVGGGFTLYHACNFLYQGYKYFFPSKKDIETHIKSTPSNNIESDDSDF